MSRSRTIRWVLLIVAIAALGYLGWQHFHGGITPRSRMPGSAAPARVAVPVKMAAVETARFSGLSDRPRHRSGV